MDFEQYILTYGPWAVFFLLMLSGVGIPVGEDVITIPAGILVAQNKIDPAETLLAAYAGVILADILWFVICSRYGTRLLHSRFFKRMVHPRRMLQAKHQIERHGAWVMVAARFVPGTRTTAITVAGLLHMRMWKFVLVEVICVAITAPLQVALGYLIGKGIGTDDMADLVIWIVAVATIVALIPVTIGWILRYRASHERLPRAKARWLRMFRRPRLRLKPHTNTNERG